jgi:hypothetical protein
MVKKSVTTHFTNEITNIVKKYIRQNKKDSAFLIIIFYKLIRVTTSKFYGQKT